jgi:hypothetical protein
MPFSVVAGYQCFRGLCSLHLQVDFTLCPFPITIYFTLNVEEARSSKMMAFYCNTTQHHNLEHLNLNVMLILFSLVSRVILVDPYK